MDVYKLLAIKRKCRLTNTCYKKVIKHVQKCYSWNENDPCNKKERNKLANLIFAKMWVTLASINLRTNNTGFESIDTLPQKQHHDTRHNITILQSMFVLKDRQNIIFF